MKTIITFLTFILSVPFCYSQYGTIQGKINYKTATYNEAVPYAHVVAFKNSVAVDSVYTDFEGNYKIKLPKGKYKIKIDFLGFLPFCSQTIKLKETEMKNINFYLEPTAVELKTEPISCPPPIKIKQEEKK